MKKPDHISDRALEKEEAYSGYFPVSSIKDIADVNPSYYVANKILTLPYLYGKDNRQDAHFLQANQLLVKYKPSSLAT
jgi:hypothetical protein